MLVLVRVITIVGLLFLQNCAKNMELGADGLGNRGSQMLSSQYRLQANAAPDHYGTISDSPRENRRKEARPINFDKKSHLVRLRDRRESENSNAEMVSQPVDSLVGAPSPNDASPAVSNPNFLELSADQDTENQMLKRKTVICRGC